MTNWSGETGNKVIPISNNPVSFLCIRRASERKLNFIGRHLPCPIFMWLWSNLIFIREGTGGGVAYESVNLSDGRYPGETNSNKTSR